MTAPEQPTPLLPCPFCGGEADPSYWATLDKEGGDEIMRGPGCVDCGAQAMSVIDWNHRIDRDRFAAQRAAEAVERERGRCAQLARLCAAEMEETP